MAYQELPVILFLRQDDEIETIYGSAQRDTIQVGSRYDLEKPIPLSNGKLISDGYMIIREVKPITEKGLSRLEIYADKFDF